MSSIAALDQQFGQDRTEAASLRLNYQSSLPFDSNRIRRDVELLTDVLDAKIKSSKRLSLISKGSTTEGLAAAAGFPGNLLSIALTEPLREEDLVCLKEWIALSLPADTDDEELQKLAKALFSNMLIITGPCLQFQARVRVLTFSTNIA